MSYTPPDAHNVVLDFEQPFTSVDGHNVVLNFADVEPQLGVLLATINTNIQAEISGGNWGNIDNRGALLAVIDTSIRAKLSGINDINHTRGIDTYWAAEYQRAIPYLTTPEISWSKPTIKAHHSAFFYDSGFDH